MGEELADEDATVLEGHFDTGVQQLTDFTCSHDIVELTGYVKEYIN